MYSKLSIVMFFLSFVPTTMIPTTIYSQNLPSTPSATPSPTPVAVSQGGDKNDVTLRLNERMPRWLRIGGEARMRFEGKRGIGGAKDVNDGYVMSRTRLDFSIMPAEQVTFFIQIQDSHVMGLNTSPKPSSMSNLFDLRQGYIDLKSSGKSGWGAFV